MSAASPPALRTEFLRTADGVRIAMHRLGEPGARPAVLIPGTFSNSTFWFGTRGTGFGRALAHAGYQACSVDPRGHGASARPARGDRWNFEDWGRHDVASSLDAVGQGPLVLVGHSAGGAALLTAIGTRPDLRARTHALILVGTPGPWILRGRRVAALAALLAARLLPRFPARGLRLGPEDEIPGVIEQWMRWNLDGHWRGRDGTDYSAALAGLDVPVLVVAAAGDHLWAPPAACHALFERIGSPRKEYLLCGRATGFSEDFGHVSVLVGRAARQEVWPRLIDWLGNVRE